MNTAANSTGSITGTGGSRVFKIFLASPGDVPLERKLAREAINHISNERRFRGQINIEIIAWDQLGASVAMEAAMTPQQAIAQGLPKPEDCDLAVIILWSRIGTRLPADFELKEDGTPYLSGTEWEYAARAGTTTKYWWGNKAATNNANCNGCGSEWDHKQTAPVGSFKPNPFGLYDTSGNVWEWTQDCYEGNYKEAPIDGSARESADKSSCSLRVLRGGSWNYDPQYVRSASRSRNSPAYRNNDIGFRLARTL